MKTTDTTEKHLPASKKPPRNVFFLGLVSLFNDIASEMVYPIVPLFLTTALGAPVAIVGIIEGIAEATASMLKAFSGWWSDRLRHRKGFVVMGYTLSSFSRIMLALSTVWMHVLAARFIDRFGKGTRTSARDALIADSTPASQRGAAFGFHRAMDTVGAIIGPLLAVLFLKLLNEEFSLFFWLAAIPSFIGVLILVAFVREPKQPQSVQAAPPPKLSLRQFNRPFKMFLLVNVIFALGNSSDAFLILRAKSLGFTITGAVVLYVVFNIVYALSAYPLGRLADRWGAKKVLITSFLMFAGIYAGIGVTSSRMFLWGWFALYGIFMAMSEGISKAYISVLVAPQVRATALGVFYAITGIFTFFSRLVAGLLWQYMGPAAPFFYGAALSLLAGMIFLKRD